MKKTNNLIKYLIYDDSNINHRNVKGLRFFFRFTVLNILLSPLLYPYMALYKKRFYDIFITKIYNNSVMKEWISKNNFKLKDNRLIKTDVITQNNPMFHNTDDENKLEITKELRTIFLNKLTEINQTDMMREIRLTSYVTTEFVSELDLLNGIYDPIMRENTIQELIKLKGLDSESTLMSQLNYGLKNIKTIFYTVTIEYKYVNLLRNLAINSMIIICLLLFIFIVLLTNI